MELVNSASSLTADAAVYALQVDGAALDLNGKTLYLGSGGQSGLILNGGTISGGAINADMTNIPNNQGLFVYTSLAGGVVSSQIGSLNVSKFGPGTLTLNGAIGFNALGIYAGAVDVSNVAGLPPGTGISLNGGVLQGNGGLDLTHISWGPGGGGFAAKGGSLSVGDSLTPLVWGGFIPDGAELKFGSSNSDSSVLFQNPISLGNGITSFYSRVINVQTPTVNDGMDPRSNTDGAYLFGEISGSGAYHNLVKTGNGVLYLTGSNTYTGATEISNGTLFIEDDSGLGTPPTAAYALNVTPGIHGAAETPGAVIINGGATLGADSMYQSSFALSSNRTILLASGTGAAVTPSNINVYGGENPDFPGAATLSFGGLISDYIGETGALEKTGGGTLILTGIGSYTGTLTLAAGTLNATTAAINGSNAASGIIFKGGTLQAGDGGIHTAKGVTLSGAGVFDTNGNDSALSGDITGPGAFTKNGEGTLTLSGKVDQSGATVVNGGTLTVTRTDALQNSPSLTVSNLGASSIAGFNFVTGASGRTLNLAALTLDGMQGPVAIGAELGNTIQVQSPTGATTAGDIRLNVFGVPGDPAPSGTYNLVTAASGLNGGSFQSSYTLGNVYNNTNFTVGGVSASPTALSVTATPAAALATAYWGGGFTGGSHAWAISDGSTNSNWWTGVDGGASPVVPGPTTAVVLSGNGATNQDNMTLGASMIIDSLRVTDGSSILLQDGANSLTINGDSAITLDPVAGQTSLNVGLVFAGAAPVVAINNASGLTLGGPITAANGFTKTGAGTLVLNSPTTSGPTGALTIAEGTVQAGSAISGVLYQGDIAFGGSNTPTLDLNGSSSTIGLLSGGANGVVTNSSNKAATLTLGGAGSQSFGGVIGDGNGGTSLVVNGPGTQTLTGANTYTGTTTITQGTLIASDIAVSGGSSSLGNSASRIILGGDSTMGTLGYNGAAVTTFNRGITINAGGGALLTAGTGEFYIPGGAGGIADNSILGLGTTSSGNLKIATVISGTGRVVVNSTGSGNVILDANNTFTGGVTVNQGMLALDQDFGARALGSNAVTLGGLTTSGTLNFTSNGGNLYSPLSVNAGGGTVTMNSNGFNDWLTLSGPIALRGNLTIDSSGWYALRVVSQISGIGGINITSLEGGDGETHLYGANSYTGATTLTSGALYTSNVSIDGSATSGIVFNGGTLVAMDGINTSKPVTMTGNGDFNTNGNNSTLSGILSGAGTLTKAGAGTLTLTGVNTGFTGGIVINDGGTLNTSTAGINGSDSTNGIWFNGGTLQAGAGGITTAKAINLSWIGTIDTNGSDVTLSGLISGGGGNALTKTGLGTLTLNSSTTSGFWGPLTLNAGTLVFDYSNMVDPSSNLISSRVRLSNGNWVLQGKSGAGTSNWSGPLDLLPHTGNTITLDAHGGDGMAVNANLGRDGEGGATVNVNLTNAGSNGYFRVGWTNQEVGYTTVTDAGGTGFGYADGSNHLVRYTGGTALTDSNATDRTSFHATTTPTDAGYDGATKTLTLSAASMYWLEINSGTGGTLDLGTNTLTLGDYGGLLMNGAGNYTIANGQVGATDREVIVHQFGTGALTISAPVSGGAGSLVKDGPGLLILSGANTYGGATTISGGTLQFAGSFTGNGAIYLNNDAVAQIGISNALNGNAINFGTGSSSKLQLNGYDLTVGDLNSSVGTGGTPIVENGGSTPATLTFNGADNQTFGGVIQDGTGGGALNLNKTNNSTLTLTGANTFTGQLILTGGIVNAGTASVSSPSIIFNGGTLQAAQGGIVNGNAVSMIGNATFDTNGNNSTLSGNISSTGVYSFTKVGAGTLTLSGANSYSGPTAINGGTLAISASNNLGDNSATNTISINNATLESTGNSYALGVNQAISLNNNATFQVDSGDLAVSGIVSGGGTLTKTGAGILTLSGANTFGTYLNVVNGFVSVSSIGNAGQVGPLGTNGTIVLGSATSTGGLIYTGAGETTDRTIYIPGNINGTSGAILDASGTGLLRLATAISLAYDGAKTITLQGTGTGEIDGPITDGLYDWYNTVTSIVKNGSGTWSLLSANAFSGTVTLNGGVLAMPQAGFFGGGGTGLDHGIWQYYPAFSGMILTGGTFQALGGVNEWAPMSITGSGGFDTNGTVSMISGAITGSGSLIKSGDGILTLNNSYNTFTGGLVINSGTVQVGTGAPGVLGAGNVTFGASNAPTLDINGGNPTVAGLLSGGPNAVITTSAGGGSYTLNLEGNADQTFAGTIKDGSNATIGITQNGQSTLFLTGFNTYSGPTNIGQGAISVADATHNLGTSRVVLGGPSTSGTLIYTGGAGTFANGISTNDIGGSVINAGTGLLTVNGQGMVVNSTLTFGLSDQGINIDTNMSGAGIVAINGTGAGVVKFSGVNATAGGFNVLSGTLEANSNAVNITGGVTFGAAGTPVFDLNGFNANVGRLYGNSGVVANNAIGGTSMLTFSGGPGGTQTYGGVIQDGASGGVVGLNINLGNPGNTQVLTGVNTFTGPINIYSGNLGISTVANINGGDATNGITLNSASNWNYGSLMAMESGTLTIAKPITIAENPNGGYGGFNTNGYNVTLIGSITGGEVSDDWNQRVIFNKTGAGTLTLVGQSNYIGRTVVSSGTLQLGNGSSWGGLNYWDHTDVYLNGGDLAFNYSGSQGFWEGIWGGGAVYINGGTVHLGNWNQQTGGTIVTNGSLQFGWGGNLGATASPLILNNSTLEKWYSDPQTIGYQDQPGRHVMLYGNNNIQVDDGPARLTFNGPIGGPGGFTKTGYGTAILTYPNTYQGNTGVNNGTLSISSSDNLGDGSATNTISFNGGTLESTGNSYDLGVNRTIAFNGPGAIQVDADTVTVSGVVSGVGPFYKTGAGTLALTGANTYSGNTIIIGGVLAINSSASLGNGSITNTISLNNGTLESTGNSYDLGVNRVISLSGAGTFQVDADTVTVSGNIFGGNSLTKTGDGILVLNGQYNSFTGGLFINQGTVQPGNTHLSVFGAGNVTFGTSYTPTVDINGVNATIGLLNGSGSNGIVTNNAAGTGTATLTVNGNGVQTFNGVIKDGATAQTALTVTGAGTQVLTGANTYTGLTTVTGGGTLELDFSALGAPQNDIIADTALVLGGAGNGALQVVGADSTTNSQSFNGLTVGEGQSTINVTSGASGAVNLNLGAISRNAGGLLNFSALPASGLITTSNADGLLGGWAVVNGTDWAAVSGGVIGANTDYSPFPAPGLNTDMFGDASVSDATTNSLRFNTPTNITLTLGGANVIQSGGILVTGAVGPNALAITGGTLTSGNGQDLIVHQLDAAGSMTIDSTIIGGLTVSNAGTLTIGAVQNGAGRVTLMGAGSTNLNGLINGSGGLTVDGPGSVTVNNAGNTYTGGTILNAGTLRVGSGGNLGSGSVTLNGGALNLTNWVQFWNNFVVNNGVIHAELDTHFYFSGILSGNGPLTLSGDGTFHFTNANTFTGPLTLIGSSSNSGLWTTTAGLNGSDTTNGITFLNNGAVPALAAETGGLATAKSINLTMGNGALFGYNGNLLLSGAIFGNHNLFTGGSVYLTGTNSNFTGQIQMWNGVVNVTTASLGNANSVCFNGGSIQAGLGGFVFNGWFGGGNTTIDTNGSDSAVTAGLAGWGGYVLKVGAGTLTVGGASNGNNNLVGDVLAVRGGTFLLDYTNYGSVGTQLLNASRLFLGGGTFSMKGNAIAATTTQTFSDNFSLEANSGNAIVLTPAAGQSINLTLTNTWTRATGSSLLIDLSAGNATLTSSPTLTGDILGYALVKDTTGTGFATVSGGNVVRYDDTMGANLADNSNDSSVNFTTLGTASGTLAWSNGLTNRAVNSLTIDTTNNFGTIDMGASGNVLSLTSGAILFRGANNEVLTGGQVGAAGSEVIVHQVGTGTLTINSPISSGAGSLIKDGDGLLVLGGANTYLGATFVNGGTLRLIGASTLANSSSLSVGPGAVMDFSQGLANQSIGNLLDEASNLSGTVMLPSGTLTINEAANTTFDGTFTGTGNLTKAGGGTLTLKGNNLATGLTTITDGTLSLDYNGSAFNASSKLGSGGLVLGGNLTMQGNPYLASSESVNGLTLIPGTNNITLVGKSQNLTLAVGAITRNLGGTVNFSPSSLASETVQITTTNTNTNGILGGWATFNGDWAAVNGGKIGAYTGGYVNDAWAPGNNTNVTYNQVINSGTTNSVRFSGGDPNFVLASGLNTIESGGILVTPALAWWGMNIYSWGGTLTSGNGQDLIIHQYAPNSALNIDAPIVGNIGLTLDGVGLTRLRGASTFTGPVNVNGGTLDITNSGAISGQNSLNIAAGATVSMNTAITTGPLSGAGNLYPNLTVNETSDSTFSGYMANGWLTKSGSGTLTLTGHGTVSPTLNDGTLKLDYSSSTASKLGGWLSMQHNSNLILVGNAFSPVTQQVSDFTYGGAGPGNTSITLAGQGQNLTLDLGNFHIDRGNGSILNLYTSNSGAATSSFKTSSAVNVLIAWITYNNSDFAIMPGDGTLVPYTAYNNGGAFGTWADPSTWAGNNYDLSDNVTTPYNSGSISSDTTIGSLKISNAASPTITIESGATLTLGLDAIMDVAGSGTFTIAGPGNLKNGVAGVDTTIAQYNTVHPLIIGANIIDNSSSAVTKVGAGTLILTGANTYNGGTFINEGTVQLGDGGTTGSLSANGGIFLLSNSAVLAVDHSDAVTISNPIVGLGGVKQMGTGSLTLSGANSFSGGVNITDGTVVMGNAGALGSGPVTFSGPNATMDLNGFNLTLTSLAGGNGNLINNASNSATSTLTLNVSGAETFSGVIADGSSPIALTLVSGTQTLAGANTYSGPTTIDGGILKISAPENLGDGSATNTINLGAGTLESTSGDYDLGSNRTITLTGAGTIQTDAGTMTVSGNVINGANTLTVQGAGNTVFSGSIGSGAGGFTKGGSGTVTLSGASTYTGPTNVNAGTLIVSGGIGGSLTTIASGATLASGNNVTSTVGGPVNALSNGTGGATVAPGGTGGPGLSTIGNLNVNGDLNLGTNATAGRAHLSMELGGTTAGTEYDQVTLAGSTLNLNNVNLDLSLINFFTPAEATYNSGTNLMNLDGEVFYLVIGAGAINGTFANQQGADSNVPGFNTITIGGHEFAISYTASSISNTFSGAGNDIALMAIPEPSTWALLLGGLGVLGFWQRSRRSKA